MAKWVTGFNKRFPYFGIFLVIALLIAIPLTVWSLFNVPTNTTQFAQSPKCGAYNKNPACPNDFVCNFVNANPLLGGNCVLSKLNPPTNLKAQATCKLNWNKPNDMNLNLTWKSSNNANGYIIYGNYYYLEKGRLVNVNVNPFTSQYNYFTLNLPVPHGVKYYYWHVKAFNSTFNVFSPISINSSVILNCK